jgi:putative flippase GtrA
MVRRLLGSRRGARATKSLIGSMVATVASEIAFAACYGSGALGTTASSAVAFIAGAIPNYVLNRSWAWERKGRVRVWREVVLYAVVSLLSFAASAVATGATAHAVRDAADHSVRVALVSASYLATYAVLFVGKFLAYEFVIFADPRAEPVSRSTTETPDPEGGRR